tara:strand:+ start:410 stop:733 length:324 start_codon:yes stop_codon:yes gene_type:complete
LSCARVGTCRRKCHKGALVGNSNCVIEGETEGKTLVYESGEKEINGNEKRKSMKKDEVEGERRERRERKKRKKEKEYKKNNVDTVDVRDWHRWARHLVSKRSYLDHH